MNFSKLVVVLVHSADQALQFMPQHLQVQVHHSEMEQRSCTQFPSWGAQRPIQLTGQYPTPMQQQKDTRVTALPRTEK